MKDYLELFQNKENRKIIRDYLNEVYTTFKAHGNNFIEKFTHKITSNLEYTKEVFFYPGGYFNVKNNLLVNEIKNKIKNGIHCKNELLAEFQPECKIQVGHKVDCIPEVYKFGSDNPQTKNYIIEEGKSTIIYIWSYHSILSKKHLHYLSDSFKSNQRNWDAHIRIVFINIDTSKDKEKAVDLVKHLKIYDMTHFELAFDENLTHPFVTLTMSLGYPLTIAINSDNVVQMIGSLLDLNLEKIVKESVHRNLITSQTVFQKGGMKDEDKVILKSVINDLEGKVEALKSNNSLNAPHLVDITFTVKRVYVAGKFNLTNPKYNNNHQNLQTPNSDSTLRMTKKVHPTKQKNVAKELIIGGVGLNNTNSNNYENLGVNPLKTGSKFYPQNKEIVTNYTNVVIPTENNKSEKQIEKQTYTPKMYFAELTYSCHFSDEDSINEIFKGLGNMTHVSINKTHTKTGEIDFGSTCYNCQSPLVIKIPSKANSELGDDENFNQYTYTVENTIKKRPKEINLENINYLENLIPSSNEIKNTLGTDNINFVYNNGEKQVRNVRISDKIKIYDKQFTDLSNYEDLNNLNNIKEGFDYSHLHQYHCIFCSIHLCYECGNSQSDINHPNTVHNHNLILLRNSNKHFNKYILQHNFENDYNADFKYFQTNHFPRDLNYFKTHYQVKCDGCLIFPITTTRWKCCNCVFKNVCDKCFSAFTHFSDKESTEIREKGHSQFADEIMANLHKLGCDPVEHVFMKILFDGYFY